MLGSQLINALLEDTEVPPYLQVWDLLEPARAFGNV